MEPVKGGGLIQLPEEAKAVLDGVGTGSYASYAVRYAASFEGVFMVLSGMSNYEQLADNVSYMKDFQPFTSAEYKAVERVREMEEDAHRLESDHTLTAELIERLIDRIEITHDHDIHVTFRFQSEFTEQRKAVPLCANT